MALEHIPTPPGSPQHPIRKTVRMVSAKHNPTMIVSIPKIIALNCDIENGTELQVWMEKTDDGKYRIILEKED